MDEPDWLAQLVEANRPHLRAVGYRMLGSVDEADDAIHEARLRLTRTDTQAVQSLAGWLTAVVARVCLDMLRARRLQSDAPPSARRAGPVGGGDRSLDPEDEALLADAVGLALLVVLEALEPGERLALVLHDVLEVPVEEIALIADRSPAATRALVDGARRRVRGQPPRPPPGASPPPV